MPLTKLRRTEHCFCVKTLTNKLIAYTGICMLHAPVETLQHKGATTGGWRVLTPNFLEDPQLLTQRFCRGVYRQASRVNLVYNTEEERNKKFFLLLLQVLFAFLCLVYGLKFSNVNRFLYIKFILLICILSVRRANDITSLIYL